MLIGRKAKKIAELSRQLELAAVSNKALVLLLATRDAQIRDLQHENKRLKMTGAPAPAGWPAQIGPIRILDVTKEPSPDFELIGLAGTAAAVAANLVVAKIFRRSYQLPSLPQGSIYYIRYFDQDCQQEKKISERAFKKMLEAKNLL